MSAEIACVMGNDLIEFLDTVDPTEEGAPPGYNPDTVNLIVEFEQATSGSKIRVPILLLITPAEFERHYEKAKKGRRKPKLDDGFDIVTELSVTIRRLQKGETVNEASFAKQTGDLLGYALAALRAHDEDLFTVAIRFEAGTVLYTHVDLMTGDEGVENEHFCSQAWAPNGDEEDEAAHSLFPGSDMVH